MLCLGTDADFFGHALAATYSHMRINHDPSHEAIAHVEDEGVFAHQDESRVTLLLQDDNSGLRVMCGAGIGSRSCPTPKPWWSTSERCCGTGPAAATTRRSIGSSPGRNAIATRSRGSCIRACAQWSTRAT